MAEWPARQPRLWTILLDISILTFSNNGIHIHRLFCQPMLRQLNGRLTYTHEHKNYGIIFFNYSMRCIELNNLTSSIWKHLNCEVEKKTVLFLSWSCLFFLSFLIAHFSVAEAIKPASRSDGRTVSVASVLQCAD